jgi:S1-C subfamily serine protease
MWDSGVGRSAGILLAACIALAIPLQVSAEEGLYRVQEIELPAAVRAAIPSVVRVFENIAFDVQVFADADALKANASVHPERDNNVFKTGGGVLWPVDITFADLSDVCSGPTRKQPGNSDLCTAFARTPCASHACRFGTDRLGGSATGFVVGRADDGDLLIMTAYHVAREGIERLGRTSGVYAAAPAPAPDLEVQLSTDARRRSVQLIANASAEDWRNGRDWALLKVLGTSTLTLQSLPIAASRAKEGDELWVIGFPTRTERRLAADAGYPNASDELRVSVGRVRPSPDGTVPRDRDDTFADADGVAGNSGSPALNSKGEVTGLFRAHTYYRAGEDLRIANFGGLAELTPASILAQGLESLRRKHP